MQCQVERLIETRMFEVDGEDDTVIVGKVALGIHGK